MALENLVRQMALHTGQAKDELKNQISAPATHEEILGLELQPGTRVLDLVTGQHAEVVSGQRTNSLIQAS